VQNTYIPAVLGVEHGLFVLLAVVTTALLVVGRRSTGGFIMLLCWSGSWSSCSRDQVRT
jgi:hypothetical protein